MFSRMIIGGQTLLFINLSLPLVDDNFTKFTFHILKLFSPILEPSYVDLIIGLIEGGY